MMHRDPSHMPTMTSTPTREKLADLPAAELVDLGSQRAGSQGRLADAIDHSKRLVSNWKTGKLPLSQLGRDRLIDYLITGQTIEAPPEGHRRRGRKPKTAGETETFGVALALTEAEYEQFQAASQGYVAKMSGATGYTGLLEDAVAQYLDAYPEALPPAPPVPPEATKRTRQKLHPTMFGALDEKIPSVEARGDYIRQAVLAFLDPKARLRRPAPAPKPDPSVALRALLAKALPGVSHAAIGGNEAEGTTAQPDLATTLGDFGGTDLDALLEPLFDKIRRRAAAAVIAGRADGLRALAARGGAALPAQRPTLPSPKRSSTEIEESAEEIHGYLKANPWKTAEEISEALKIPTRQLKLSIKRLRGQGSHGPTGDPDRLKRFGERKAMRYAVAAEKTAPPKKAETAGSAGTTPRARASSRGPKRVVVPDVAAPVEAKAEPMAADEEAPVPDRVVEIDLETHAAV